VTPDDLVLVRDVPLRRDPARDASFTVVHDQVDMVRVNDESPRSQREKLHLEVNNELQSLEIAAQCLIEFPDAPWELRLFLARQCWDESRHARLAFRRLLAKGGHKGEFPILNQEWGIVCAIRSLVGRLAVQNRTFEAGSLDVFDQMVDWWRDLGDDETADDMDGICADEVLHVRFANDWIEAMVRDEPRALLDVSSAITQLRRAVPALTPRPGEHRAEGAPSEVVVPANVRDRANAGFTDEAVDHVARLAGGRT
jgi:uncharacterized ferritin-like protein (DUF455 family)